MFPAWHDLPRWPRAALKGLALALVYLAGALVGAELSFVRGNVSPLWPATGLAVVALARWGYGHWPAVYVGATLANLLTGPPSWTVPVVAVGGVLEVVLAVWALRRLEVADGLGDIRHVLRLLVVVALAPLASTAIGPPALALAGDLTVDELSWAMAVWWLGDAMGFLIVVPFLGTWTAPPPPGSPRAGGWELTAMTAATLVTATLAFGPLSEWIDARLGRSPLEFMVFPTLLWAAIRGGPRAASLMLAVIAVVAVVRTTAGHGPFAAVPMPHNLVLLELFLASTVIATLLLAASVCACKKLIDDLDAARAGAECGRAETARLMATLRHDLAHPLQAATLFLAAMRSQPLPDHARPLLDRTVASLRAMEEMLMGMKEVTSVEAGEEVHVQDVPLSQIMDLLAEEAEVLATARGLAFRYVRCSATVRTDPVLLARMVRNLLANAVRYTGSGRVLLGCRRLDGRMRIEVRDTGPGIPPAETTRIFEAFRRGASTGDGVGLGLAIVRRLAEHLGHDVGVSSREGRGTCFWVTVPLAR